MVLVLKVAQGLLDVISVVGQEKFAVSRVFSLFQQPAASAKGPDKSSPILADIVQGKVE